MPACRSTPVRIVVVAEAEADRRMVCGLIDRKIAHHAPDWFDRDDAAAQLDALRVWCGLEPGVLFTRWNSLKYLSQPGSDKAPGLRALGFGPLQGQGYDRPSMRKALIHFKLMQPPADALVISRDLDGQHTDERRASLEEGASEINSDGVCICLAIQNPMREAWLLNGFDLKTPTERKVFESERAAIGFDPCCQAERLSTADESALRSAKRVLRVLSGDNREREEACWLESEWPVLRERGLKTGLTAFLDAVKDRLVQLVTGEPLR